MYVTLYRKYRPRTFAQVIGQQHVTKTLINALKADKTSHAYLFAGPRGTGKTSIAKILAKALNCSSQQPAVRGQGKEVDGQPRPFNNKRDKRSTVNEPFEPCNSCDSCISIDSSSSIDVLEIDAASNRGIDEIRELRERVHFAPSQGSKKVFIIDEVHMLTTEAFNALLKMIEEPPAHAVFILATTEIHKVIPTIVSRCQRFDFRRVLTGDITRRLSEIAQKEKIKVDESTLAVIARQAQGSVRDSIGLLDQLATFADKKISPEVLSSVLNLTESELLFEITDLIVKKDTLSCLKFIDKLMNKGFDLRQFTAELIEHFRSITIALATKQPADVIHTTDEILNRIKSQASQFQIFEAIKVIDLLSDVYRQMRFSADARLLLEIALIKLTKLESDLSLEGLLYRVEELEKMLEVSGETCPPLPAASGAGKRGRDEKIKKPTSRHPESIRQAQGKLREGSKDSSSQTPQNDKVAEGSTVNDKIQRAWPVVMQQLKKESIPLYSLMLECHPKTEDSKLILIFNQSAGFHLKEASKNSKVIRKVLKNIVGLDFEVDFALDEAQINNKQVESQSENLSTDHVIKMMKDNFGAEVIE